MRTKGRSVVVAGALARRASAGGHAWVFLNWLLGFRRLGYDVLFVDWVDHPDPRAARRLAALLGRFDVPFSLLADGRPIAGLARDTVLRRTRDAALLLNVMGYLLDDEILAAARRRVFLDIDPGFGQMWRELGLADVFAGHDAYVTIAANVGRPGCSIPACGVDWITTRQPVVLDLWPPSPGRGRRFTTVASWRGPYAAVSYGGRRYGVRAHEFRRFASLPRLTGCELEIALEIDDGDERDRELLEAGGWRIVDPERVAGDPASYRDYIAGSGAEFMVAKEMYVQTRSGWFSDRSACYLASGKPVLAQDTGLGDLPRGEGLVTFTTLDDAVAGSEAILSAPARHARAAREVAEEYFDSDRVIGRLAAELEVA